LFSVGYKYITICPWL